MRPARVVAGDHFIRISGRAMTSTLDYNDDEESQGSRGPLAPLRTELMRGDLRVAYLAWLLAVGAGEVGEEDTEPPVPPGLSQLDGRPGGDGRVSPHRRGFVRRSRRGEHRGVRLLARAPKSGRSRSLRARRTHRLCRAIDDPHLALGGELLQRSARRRSPRSAAGRRTVAELRATAEKRPGLRGVPRRARGEGADRRGGAQERLDALAKRVDAAWAELSARRRSAYEEAIKLATIYATSRSATGRPCRSPRPSRRCGRGN